MRRPIRKSILRTISALVTVLCVIIMIFSAYTLYTGLNNNHQATVMRTVHDMTRNFAAGLSNFMFERGRMNVVLAKTDPISEDNVAFLNERRTVSDAALKTGFTIMADTFPAEAQSLRDAYEEINVLRSDMDREASKPLGKRNIDVRDVWLRSSSGFIDTVMAKLSVTRQIVQQNGLFSQYFRVVNTSLNFRNVTGYTSSIVTSTIAGSGNFTPDHYAELQFQRGKEAQLWSELEDTIAIIESDNLSEALTSVQNEYYVRFRPEQDRIIELINKHHFVEGADVEMASLSVPALDSVLQLSDAAVREIAAANERNIDRGHSGLVISIVQMLISALIGIFIPLHFRLKFINPLNDIMVTQQEISEGSLDSVTPHLHRKDEIGQLAQGANLLKKNIREKRRQQQELEALTAKLADLSMKDSLTSLYNRRYMTEIFEKQIKIFKQFGTHFSVIICDIDEFKRFNDSYGHEMGDKVLIYIPELLSAYRRDSDVLARWGGEEFLFLLPDTGLQGAGELAEQIRAGIENETYACDPYQLRVTMTFGAAEYMAGENMRDTLLKADMALLRGKNNGRNQVVLGNIE